MKLIITKPFYDKLNRQVKFIARDKPVASKKFRKELMAEIRKIPNRSKSHKKSSFFDNENFREMIFKGYRVVYEIKEDQIMVFGFHKWEGDLNV